jgi:hypothetical protein
MCRSPEDKTQLSRSDDDKKIAEQVDLLTGTYAFYDRAVGRYLNLRYASRYSDLVEIGVA